MPKQKLLTTRIAAQQLGFKQDYVRELCAKGKIKAQRLGHDWVIDEKALKNIKRQRKERNHEPSGE